jgi:hypothetical protein
MTAVDGQSQEADFGDLDAGLVADLETSAIGRAQLRHLQLDLPQGHLNGDSHQSQPRAVQNGGSKRVRSLW